MLAERLLQYDAVTAKNPSQISRVKNTLINEFIHKSYIESWAQKNNFKVTEELLDEEVNRVRKSYTNDEAFRESLAKEQIKYSDWRESLRSKVLARKLFESFAASVVAPAESEIESYYKSNPDQFKRPEQVKISQIVLEKNEDAQKILASLLKKEKSFEELARQFSISPEKSTGGSVGWIEKGSLEVFDKVFSQGIDKLSPIIQSPYGFHILKVTDKRSASSIPLAQAKAEITKQLLSDRQQALYSAWLENQIKLNVVYKNQAIIDGLSIETGK